MLLAKITAIPPAKRTQAHLTVPVMILDSSVKDEYSGTSIGNKPTFITVSRDEKWSKFKAKVT